MYGLPVSRLSVTSPHLSVCHTINSFYNHATTPHTVSSFQFQFLHLRRFTSAMSTPPLTHNWPPLNSQWRLMTRWIFEPSFWIFRVMWAYLVTNCNSINIIVRLGDTGDTCDTLKFNRFQNKIFNFIYFMFSFYTPIETPPVMRHCVIICHYALRYPYCQYIHTPLIV